MYIFQRKNFLDLVEGVSAENSYFSYGKQPNVTQMTVKGAYNPKQLTLWIKKSSH